LDSEEPELYFDPVKDLIVKAEIIFQKTLNETRHPKQRKALECFINLVAALP